MIYSLRQGDRRSNILVVFLNSLYVLINLLEFLFHRGLLSNQQKKNQYLNEIKRKYLETLGNKFHRLQIFESPFCMIKRSLKFIYTGLVEHLDQISFRILLQRMMFSHIISIQFIHFFL